MINRDKGAKTEIAIREAQPDDARLIWEWANDPSVRANSFNPAPIPWEKHLSWYENKLASTATRFWLLIVDDKPVGQIRYDKDREGKSAEISFSVAREHRGKGYGVELIGRTCQRACTELDVEEITALTFAENAASHQAFLRNEFKSSEIVTIDGRECYQLHWRPRSKEG